MSKIGQDGRNVALDGLRGLAVTLVIAMHLGFLGCGWIGVQLFFVLSGFLITRILIDDASHRTFGNYLVNFYRRRARRILPVLYLYLGLIFLVSILAGAADSMREPVFAAAFFYHNIYLVTEIGIDMEKGWALFSTRHLWSLSVEEHFYILWPFLLYWCAGRQFLLIVICVALGPVLRAVTASIYLEQGWNLYMATLPVYLLSTSHIDAFASGALVAHLSLRSNDRTNVRASLWICTSMLVYSLGAWTNQDWGLAAAHGMSMSLGFPVGLSNGGQYIWGYSVLNLLFAQLIWLCLYHDSFSRLFSWKPLAFTGRISYGLYLFHFPVLFIFLKGKAMLQQSDLWSGELMLAFVPLYVAVSVGLAWLSFRYYETPLLHDGGYRRRQGGRSLTQAAAN